MDNYTVYMHVSPSGKRYIGITGQSIERRWGSGNFITKYESLTIAGQTIGGDIRNISACCLGKKKTAYGYVWRYESEVV